MRRLAIALVGALALALPAPTAAGVHSASLSSVLSRSMARAGGAAGAYVVDITTGRRLFTWNGERPRILASNTKIFTTSTALGRYGAQSSLATVALAGGPPSSAGVVSGNLYLRGGGDPTFGSRSFASSAYGSRADVQALATRLRAAGVRRITGAVVGDETLWDSRRGGPDSGYRVSIYVGPLSALSFDRGFASRDGSSFQRNPPLLAAARLTAALKAGGVHVGRAPRTGATPGRASELAEVRSPTLARLVQITDKNSDNYFAEMIAKGLSVDAQAGGPLRQAGAAYPAPGTRVPRARRRGTTAAGAGVAAAFARTLGARPTLVDGSGLSRADRASPHSIVNALASIYRKPWSRAFYDALSIAGRDGTLMHRMNSGPASGRCHGKTGTLNGVSALSGYCPVRGGHVLAFSILMNGAGDIAYAHRLQDSMVEAIAGS